MNINDYLDSKNMTQNDFATLIGRSPSYITKFKKQLVTPSLIEAIIIYLASDQHVNLQDMIPLNVMKHQNQPCSKELASVSFIKHI